MAQPFDWQRLELSGEPAPLLDQVARHGRSGSRTSPCPRTECWPGARAPRRSPTADLVRPGGPEGRDLGEPAVYHRPVLSPDEKSVAICREESETNADIWILDAARGAGRRLTFDPHFDCGPTWSPDGTRIAFRSDRRGVPEIYQKRADGSGDDELLLPSRDSPSNVTDWSADGRFLVYSSSRPRFLQDLFLLALSPAAERKPIAYLVTEALEDSGGIAPNGRWMAYRSTQHGRFEVYVREVSAQWRGGGGDVADLQRGRLGAPVAARQRGAFLRHRERDHGSRSEGRWPTFEASPPRPSSTLGLAEEPGVAFEVSRDGQRFLMLVADQTAASRSASSSTGLPPALDCRAAMLHSPGTRLGPYEIVSPLGAGGMGEVYKARDTRLERTVAVKVSKEAFEERFRNEALTVAALNHPHVCALFDVGPDYLVMEYVEGKPPRGPLPVAEVLRLATQIADALDHAHRQGIVHRDLKPSNILLTKGGMKVLDFGLAKRQPRGPVTGAEPDAHRGRDGLGHAAVHGPGADRREAGRRAHRHLRVRAGPLRVADRASTHSRARARPA